MALRIPVLVRGINNLSDARYCAGMGADGLIFTLDPELPGAIDPATVQELAGWVAGVELIGELGPGFDAAQLVAVAAACGLSRVLLRGLTTPGPTPLPLPAIVKIPQFSAFDGAYRHQLMLSLAQAFPAGFELLTQTIAPATDGAQRIMAEAAAAVPLWLGGNFTPESVAALLDGVRPAGLVLQGGDELKPGLRDFTGLEEIFEALEEAE